MLAQRLHDLRARRAAGETGFTLVELLVVVVIIVALAAIAVPIFLNQQERAADAAVTSDLAAAGKFISAGIADGSLSETGPAPVEAGTGDATGAFDATVDSVSIYSSTGTFVAPVGMAGAWTATGFCVDATNGFKISNTSGGVVPGSCA